MASIDQHTSVSKSSSEQVSPNGAISPGGPELQPHIVVVNDTQEILDLFRDILEEEGYRVSLYSYAFQEVGEIQSLRPDLVILDFVIGGEAHGWQLLQKMKMTRETMGIPVIVCTAALQLARELNGHLKAKNVTVVLKPFDIDDLLRAVASSLAKPNTTASVDLSQPG